LFCRKGLEAIIKYLVEHGADIHKIKKKLVIFFLFYICENDNLNLVNYLVEHRLDIHRINCFGEFPLFYNFKKKDDLNIIKYLVRL